MSRRADVVSGTAGSPVLAVPGEFDSGVGPASTREQHMNTKPWPLRSHMELGALPTAVPCARLHSRQMLWEWGLAGLSEVVELIVSELTTNAVQASEGLMGCRYKGQWRPGVPPVRLWLTSDKERVLIQVWDGNHMMPKPQEPELEAEGGRGLMLVEALSEQWGAYVPEGGGGKVVWGVVRF
jgi:anti-sigma regulatory factor (Ser/Thr protein kinase)